MSFMPESIFSSNFCSLDSKLHRWHCNFSNVACNFSVIRDLWEIHARLAHYTRTTRLLRWKTIWIPEWSLYFTHWTEWTEKACFCSNFISCDVATAHASKSTKGVKPCVLSQQWAGCTWSSQRMCGLCCWKRTQTTSSKEYQTDYTTADVRARVCACVFFWLELHLTQKKVI